jgi:hypothetical protein
MSHDEEGVVVRIECHRVAAIGEGFRTVFAAGESERADVFKVRGSDRVRGGRRERLGLRFV